MQVPAARPVATSTGLSPRMHSANLIAIAMRHPKRPDLTAMITASASEPGRYQLTWADDAGPSGHTTRDTAEEAVRHAVEEGYRLSYALTDDARIMAERVQAAHEGRVAEIDAWLTGAC